MPSLIILTKFCSTSSVLDIPFLKSTKRRGEHFLTFIMRGESRQGLFSAIGLIGCLSCQHVDNPWWFHFTIHHHGNWSWSDQIPRWWLHVGFSPTVQMFWVSPFTPAKWACCMACSTHNCVIWWLQQRTKAKSPNLGLWFSQANQLTLTRCLHDQSKLTYSARCGSSARRSI